MERSNGASAVKTARITSVDALRGFDMFWIKGGEGLVHSLYALLPVPVMAAIDGQFEHVEWAGFHFYDLIFPLFLFLVGVVLPFSMGRHAEEGADKLHLYWRALRRLALLFFLGLIYNGLFQTPLHELRIPGVLQRIAICYFIAAIVVIHLKARGQAIVAGALLLGYWAIMMLVPVPGVGAGDLSPAGNLSGYIDRLLIPRPFCCYDFGDNEGLLSTIPAVATTLLGALAGWWLRSGREPAEKAKGLAMAGVVCLAAGSVWSIWFPIIKNIWSSSFVLFAGGWSLLLLALFYWIIDVRGYKRWSFFFLVIGANAILIYVLRGLINLNMVLRWLGYVPNTIDAGWMLVLRLVELACFWLLLLFLYRKRWFLRV
ncbi:MAG: DUF5009 domain-containing protein [Bryobacterales bacterium]|nr:DUF5009 domain-containing protein [Bryobacterales bacterium]